LSPGFGQMTFRAVLGSISDSNGSSKRYVSDITASALGRVIAAGGEDLSTPSATTNVRNGAQGATSEVGRYVELYIKQRIFSSAARRTMFDDGHGGRPPRW